MRSIRVLLVDPSRPFLRAASHFLAAKPGIEVVGCLGSTAEALEQVPVLRPDVVLVELAAPTPSTLKMVGSLKDLPEAPRVVLVTAWEEAAYLALAERVPVDGVVSKHGFCTELLLLLEQLYASRPAAEAPATEP
jgi:two-component system nitrate/nitrite response regulator NarL